MADKWHSLVDRTCETCGQHFRVQYQSAIRKNGGKFCSARCNPRVQAHNKAMVALSIGPKRAKVEVTCATCGAVFSTRVKNIARGGGKYCTRQCNPAYQPRFSPSEKNRRYNLAQNYGMTVAEYEAMLAGQRGKCAICGTWPDGRHGVLFVDHDHFEDRVRELLCGNCNTAIGLLRDDPVRAASLSAYLLKHAPSEEDRHLAISILRGGPLQGGLA